MSQRRRGVERELAVLGADDLAGERPPELVEELGHVLAATCSYS